MSRTERIAIEAAAAAAGDKSPAFDFSTAPVPAKLG